jgi:hypothetical protein
LKDFVLLRYVRIVKPNQKMYFCRKQQLNMLDIHKIRADFPILDKTIYGKQLVYLDNAATTQKPRQVIDEVRAFLHHP